MSFINRYEKAHGTLFHALYPCAELVWQNVVEG